jgi:hypothetical protein
MLKSILMKHLLSTLLTILSFSYSPGQENNQQAFKPFSLIILKPEKASIPDSLKIYADSIERKQAQKYLATIKSLEKLKESVNEEMKKAIELQILQVKSREEEAHTFKYYHSLAKQTLLELGFLFGSIHEQLNNSNKVNIFTGDVLDPSSVTTSDLKKLGKHYRVDYMAAFENVRTGSRNGVLTLKYTIKLYSRKEDKVILKKEIEGNALVENFTPLSDIYPPCGRHEYSINCDNYLECVFKSAIRFSTEELFKEIEKRQRN